MIRNVTPDDGAAISAIYNHYVEQSDISFEEVAVTPQEMAARITSISDRYPWLTSSPTFALRVSGGGFPLLGDSCSRSTWFLLHRAA